MRLTTRLLPYLLPLLGLMQPAHADVDESLAVALESIWSGEQLSTSVLSAHFGNQVSKTGTAYRADVKNSPIYLDGGEEAASLMIGKKRFNAIATPWGNFPRLDMPNARLLAMNLPKKRYLVLAGPGDGLFTAGDWQRYSFLHVIDISSPSAPAYYPLYSDAHLGEHILGQLAGSPVLNYARLVPSSRSRTGDTEAYEVSLYALDRKGPERVVRNGVPLSYLLKRKDDAWIIEHLDRTPVTSARDEEARPFTAPLRPALFTARDSRNE
ncbi:hypothetical protein [Pseudomonas sp. SCB32]|uniref:hypothetical protein n=1 Tax=Pseudomonas sp. SCB32 TaxID=2653853 RepID=UPI00126450EF|nr:hypothetical protein [Pseudomonas sp. SCB32]